MENENYVGYKNMKPDEVVSLGKQYWEVNSSVLENVQLRPVVRYMYAFLHAFIKFNKNDQFYECAVVSDATLSKFTDISVRVIQDIRKKLVEAGYVKLIMSGNEKYGTVYAFLKKDVWYEKITRNFLFCDFLAKEDREFLVVMLPHVLRENDVFTADYPKIAEMTGYSERTVRYRIKELLSGEKQCLLKEGEYFRIDLKRVMAGMAVKAEKMAARIQELEQQLSESQKKQLRNGEFLVLDAPRSPN